jgi:hypothetical protein
MPMDTKTLKVDLTEDEWELIEAILNYKLAYPIGYPNLLFYAQQKFDELTDI